MRVFCATVTNTSQSRHSVRFLDHIAPNLNGIGGGHLRLFLLRYPWVSI